MNKFYLVSAGEALNEGLLIGESLRLFLIMMATGLVIALIYDFFRAIRKATKTAYKEISFVVHIEDVLFVLLSLVIFVFVVVVFNDGEIRGYMILGLLCGILIYWAIISPVSNRLLFWIIYFVIKIVTTPVKIVIKISTFVKKRLTKRKQEGST